MRKIVREAYGECVSTVSEYGLNPSMNVYRSLPTLSASSLFDAKKYVFKTIRVAVLSDSRVEDDVRA